MDGPSKMVVLNEFKESIKGMYPMLPRDSFLYVILLASNMDKVKAKAALKQLMDTKLKLINMSEAEFREYKPVKEIKENIVIKIIGQDFEGRNVGWSPAGRFEFRRFIQSGLKQDLCRYVFQLVEDIIEEVTGDPIDQSKSFKLAIIIDFKELSFWKLSHYETIATLLDLVKVADLLLPLMDKLYVINGPWVTSYLLNLIRPVMSKAHLGKIEFINGSDEKKWVEALKNKVPLNVLPKEYGGNGPKVLS